jgi:membrane-associated phospholipid phosphatase
VVFNIFIQLFFVKARPMVELFHLEAKETILHRFLPSSAFPSDHATVSMAIAVATLIWGYKTKNRCLMYTGYALIVVAIVMCTCRVITTLHRPTDIIGGFGVGILIPTLLSLPFLFPHVKRYLISPLIQFQEWIFSWFEKK